MLDPEVRDLIQGARDLIADPERWCQGAFAKGTSEAIAQIVNAFFEPGSISDEARSMLRIGPVSPEDPAATQWCWAGALRRAASDRRVWVDGRPMPVSPALDVAYKTLGRKASDLYDDYPIASAIVCGGVLPWVNDVLGHDAVLAVCDKVLADETVA